jgi:TetR/AcrR family transcriptional regulator, fatty acid metabolism regulator protein
VATQRSGRGVPTFTGAARRARIIDAAIATIAELGYERASYAQIAKRAGLSSTGLISYHFAGKDELVESIVAEIIRDALAFMRSRMAAARGARARLRAYIESNLAYLATHRARMVALMEIFDALPSEHEGRPPAFASPYQRVIAELEDDLRQGQRGGEFRPFSTPVMAVTIRAAIRAAAHRLSSDPDLDPIEYARELADLFERATASTPPQSRTPTQKTGDRAAD